MSRTYSHKPVLKKRALLNRPSKKVALTDYEIEFIELNLGPKIRLSF